MNEKTTKEYWNKRALEEEGMNSVLVVPWAYIHEKRVTDLFASWKDKSVLDIGCGFGRFAKYFNNYTGVDFCEEFIKKAQTENPGKDFMLRDVRKWEPKRKYDVIMAITCKSSLEMDSEEFFKKYQPFANEYIAFIEETITIKPCWE